MNNYEIPLTRSQINKLVQIAEHFKDIKVFTLEVDLGSGIGAGVSVRFNIFNTDDTKVDITDFASW